MTGCHNIHALFHRKFYRFLILIVDEALGLTFRGAATWLCYVVLCACLLTVFFSLISYLTENKFDAELFLRSQSVILKKHGNRGVTHSHKGYCV
jgi:hypothetical protein